jgi:solute carrier family 25 (mitochondrial iron transporter), member 28/37
MFPLDTIKTHAQSMGERSTMTDISKRIYSQHGMRGFFRGLPALISGAAPAHAVFFGAYEFTKHTLGGNMTGHRPFEVIVAGLSATIAMDAVLTPMDAVKQRMQLSVGSYTSLVDCLVKVRAREGLGSLYAGYSTTLVMNIPFNAVFFLAYETSKEIAVSVGKYDEDNTKMHLSCGALAGATASAVTNPLDVAKTRLQTMHETGRSYSGMRDALRQIYAVEGTVGLFRGTKPRILLHSTSSAIVWAVYEYMKRVLTGAPSSGQHVPLHAHSH